MSTIDTAAPIIPDDIARAAVLPEAYGDAAAVDRAYKWLRENMPLGQARLDNYDPIWLVTKHADIVAIERKPELFRQGDHDVNHILREQATDDFTKNVLGEGSFRILDSLTFMDPPEHPKLRGIVKDWFLLPNVRNFEEQIRGQARAAVDRLLAFDGECDFAKDFALLFPLHVIMTLFGVPEKDEPLMLQLTQELFGEREGSQEAVPDPVETARQIQAALDGFFAYFQGLADERRRNPTDDLLSLIANAELDGEPLSLGYQNGFYVAIATAGHDTTSSSISGGMLGLLQFPDQLEKVRADLSLVPGLVDESVRYTSPVKHFMRVTTAPTTVRGQQLAENDRVMLLYGSANRDEDVFDNPEAFDITRRPNKQLGFGFGPHVCIGQHVAKLEMKILWEELLPRLKSVSLAGEPRYSKTNFLGGPKSLPIRFAAA